MPEAHDPGDRTPAQRAADHASLTRLTEELVPALVLKLNASGLGELEVREGDWRVRLRRPAGSSPPATGRRAERQRIVAHPPEREPRVAREPSAADAPTGVPPQGDPQRAIATSPAVGVFRPGTAVGTRVRAGDRVAIVDLLGIPQDVIAPIDGTLVDVFVEAGEAVEYGEDIAAVEPVTEPVAADDAAGGEG